MNESLDPRHPPRPEDSQAPCCMLPRFDARHPRAGQIDRAFDALGAELAGIEGRAALRGPAGSLDLL